MTSSQSAVSAVLVVALHRPGTRMSPSSGSWTLWSEAVSRCSWPRSSFRSIRCCSSGESRSTSATTLPMRSRPSPGRCATGDRGRAEDGTRPDRRDRHPPPRGGALARPRRRAARTAPQARPSAPRSARPTRPSARRRGVRRPGRGHRRAASDRQRATGTARRRPRAHRPGCSASSRRSATVREAVAQARARRRQSTRGRRLDRRRSAHPCRFSIADQLDRVGRRPRATAHLQAPVLRRTALARFLDADEQLRPGCPQGDATASSSESRRSPHSAACCSATTPASSRARCCSSRRI